MFLRGGLLVRGYFRHTDMLKLGALLTLVEFFALLFCTGIFWPLLGF